MHFRSLLAAALAVALLGVAPPGTLLYSAPAGNRPAGIPHPDLPFDAILPSGRIVAPVGRSVAVGRSVESLALLPGGRFAVVGGIANAGATLLRVIDTKTMAVVDRVPNESAKREGVGGIVALPDPADPTSTLVIASGALSGRLLLFRATADGSLTPLAGSIELPGRDPEPMHLALAERGRLLLVADARNGRLDTIDLKTRRPLASLHVGDLPTGIAAFGSRLFVANAALVSSSLSLLSLDAGVTTQNILLDRPVDGDTTVGGVDPEAVAVEPGGRFAYVTLAGVDRVVAVALNGAPRVVSGIDLSFFANAPFGMMPTAMVPSTTGRELFVALAGANAIAVLDASTPGVLHRLGLIPSGARPIALSLAANDKTLYVANAEGNGQSATFERIELDRIPLERTTHSALRYLRVHHRVIGSELVPPLRSGRRSSSIRHVVDISLGPTYFNATPNLRQLSNAFAVVDTFYADAPNQILGRELQYAGVITPIAQRLMAFEGASTVAAMPPNIYPRAGYIVNALARAGLTYRVYNAMLPTGSRARTVAPLQILRGAVGFPIAGQGKRGDIALGAAFVRRYDAESARGTVPAYQGIALSSLDPLVQDRVLGRIVAAIAKSPQWSSTVIFISPATSIGSAPTDPDHSFAVIVSPYAKRGFVGHAHASTASILKTEEELLGLPALSLGDLLASDLANYFTQIPDPTFATLPDVANRGVYRGLAEHERMP